MKKLPRPGSLFNHLIEIFIMKELTDKTNTESRTSTDRSAGNPLIDKLLQNERTIANAAASEIVYSAPLITRDGLPIIRRGTINVIQGKQGSHKSRFAESFASLMVAAEGECLVNLGFDKINGELVTVAYVDTERTLKEELPAAIQAIMKNAGFAGSDSVGDFRYTSLKNIPRRRRLEALKEFVDHVRSESEHPLFVIIDVITDAVHNFNDPAESMQLFDFLGNLCDDYGATFLLVIHENPGTDKSRGHVGTEAINKASTVMQIGFEKGKNDELTKYLSLKFVKQRHAEKFSPIPISFCGETKSLKLAEGNLFVSLANQRDKKLTVENVVKELSSLTEPRYKQQQLMTILKKQLNCSDNTIRARLTEVYASGVNIVNSNCAPCKLLINSAPGTATIYEFSGYQKAS